MFKPFSKTLLSAVTTGSGVLSPAELNGRTEHTFYLVGSAGVSAGAVTIEASHDPDYAGTWDATEAAVTVVASTVAYVRVSGPHLALRARISTNVVDGTVSVVYLGSAG
jgi:hypothetical protein